MNTPSIEDAAYALRASLEDAKRAFDAPTHRLRYSLHLQGWPSGACGFGGMAVASSHISPCVVVKCAQRARVYHDGRFAYQVDKPTATFHGHVVEQCLMGAKEFHGGGAFEYDYTVQGDDQ